MKGVRHSGQSGAKRQGTGVRGATGWVVSTPLKDNRQTEARTGT